MIYFRDGKDDAKAMIYRMLAPVVLIQQRRPQIWQRWAQKLPLGSHVDQIKRLGFDGLQTLQFFINGAQLADQPIPPEPDVMQTYQARRDTSGSLGRSRRSAAGRGC